MDEFVHFLHEHGLLCWEWYFVPITDSHSLFGLLFLVFNCLICLLSGGIAQIFLLCIRQTFGLLHVVKNNYNRNNLKSSEKVKDLRQCTFEILLISRSIHQVI